MTNSEAGYEKKDVNVSKIVGYTIVITVFLVAILVFLNEFFIYSSEKMKAETANEISSKLRELRAIEEEVLNSYKTINAEKGVYQIPVEQAIKILADEAFQNQKKVN